MAQQLESTVLAPLDPSTVFALAHSLGDDRTAWDPTAARRMLLRGHRELGAGALVFERARNGRRTILEFDVWHPGRVSSARMVKGPFWLGDYGEGWHVRPAGDGAEVTAKLVWRHAAPLLADAAAAAMRAAFRAELEARTAALVAACDDVALIERVRSGLLPRGARHRERD